MCVFGQDVSCGGKDHTTSKLIRVQVILIRTVERTPQTRGGFFKQPQYGRCVVNRVFFLRVGSSDTFVQAIFHTVIDEAVLLRPDPNLQRCCRRHGQEARGNYSEKPLNPVYWNGFHTTLLLLVPAELDRTPTTAYIKL